MTPAELLAKLDELRAQSNACDGHGAGPAVFYDCEHDRARRAYKAALERVGLEALHALADVFALLEEGVLVRDTRGDSDPAWAIKAFAKLQRLANANAVFDQLAGALTEERNHDR